MSINIHVQVCSCICIYGCAQRCEDTASVDLRNINGFLPSLSSSSGSSSLMKLTVKGS